MIPCGFEIDLFIYLFNKLEVRVQYILLTLTPATSTNMEDSMDNQNSISNNSSNSVASSNPFDSFKMNGKYVELSPENDLKFTEGKAAINCGLLEYLIYVACSRPK